MRKYQAHKLKTNNVLKTSAPFKSGMQRSEVFV